MTKATFAALDAVFLRVMQYFPTFLTGPRDICTGAGALRTPGKGEDIFAKAQQTADQAVMAAQQAAVKNGTAPDPNGGFSAADDDTVTGLSRLLNEKLSPKEQKEWFKIFGSIDADGSGRITQEEFMRYVRKIPVKKKMMPDDVLKMVWVAIGGDAGGLKSDKFGPFMKKGQGDAGPGWKEKLAQKKASEGAAALVAPSALASPAPVRAPLSTAAELASPAPPPTPAASKA